MCNKHFDFSKQNADLVHSGEETGSNGSRNSLTVKSMESTGVHTICRTKVPACNHQAEDSQRDTEKVFQICP